MNEDSYLDASYEDRYDFPDYNLPDYRDEEEDAYWAHFEDEPEDFPYSLEFLGDGLDDIEPPF